MTPLFSRTFCLVTLLFTCSSLTGCGQNSVNAPAMASNTLTQSIANGNTQSGVPQIIALLVPLQGPLSGVGQSVKQGFMAAAQATQTSSPNVVVIDTTKHPSIQAAYNKALSYKAQMVVGPLLKTQVQTLASLELDTPVLALNYLNPDISTPPELYQFGLSPLDEVRQAVQQAWQNGRRSALIINLGDSWGSQLGQSFANEWKRAGGKVAGRLNLYQNTSAYARQLSHFLQFKPPHDRRSDFDVIFLAINPKVARQIIPLLKFYYAGDVPTYATASVYAGVPNRRLNNDLNQVIFCSAPWALGQNTPYPMLYEQLQIANSAGHFRRYRSYYALGVDAFHLTQQLAYLSQSPAQSIPGATGQLSLDSQHRIVRQLICAQFNKGYVTLVN